MRTRYNKINVFLDNEEKDILKRDSSKLNISQSAYIRNLIVGYDMSKLVPLIDKPKSKEKEVDVDKVMRIIDDNINFLTKVKNRFHYFGYNYDEQEVDKEIETLKILKGNIYK